MMDGKYKIEKMDSMVSDALDDVEDSEEGVGGQRDNQSQSMQGRRRQQPQTATETRDNNGMTDEELAEVVDNLSTKITVVGCGGGGCNTVDRMVQEGITGARLVSLNTDAQHLLRVDADEKLLVGKEETDGRGAGSIPQVGEQCALNDIDMIKDSLRGSDMVFVTAGMGGGTGTGAAPVVAKAAQDLGALTIAVVTLPFTSEGEVRRENAEAGLLRLQEVADTAIVIPNDRLLDVVGDVPLTKAFKVCDEVLMRSVKGITELITTPSIVNLDFSDVETIMENGGVAMIGLGETNTDGQPAQAVVDAALNSPLLDVDISGANSMLVNVTGGPDMSIEEAEGVVENLYDRVDPAARIIWGTGVDENLDNMLRTMVVVTGVQSDQIYGRNDTDTVDITQAAQQPQDTHTEDEEDEEEIEGDIDYVA